MRSLWIKGKKKDPTALYILDLVFNLVYRSKFRSLEIFVGFFLIKAYTAVCCVVQCLALEVLRLS